MSKPYEKRLQAIRKLLSDSLQEIVREGYDLLFDLWLENLESLEFHKDLATIAKEDDGLISEFERIISDRVIREETADYLRNLLKALPAEPESLADLAGDGAPDRVEESPMKVPEETNGQSKAEGARKVFISYSHNDEKHMKRLAAMLKPWERQSVLEIWHDREITAGNEWYQDIQLAINTCDIALLLISIDFLNSRFIQEDELPRLLQLRQEKGLRIIPIIIRDCPWTSVPILKDLQALPKDGKAVISFKGTNQPDRVWAEIAFSIANIAKTLVAKK